MMEPIKEGDSVTHKTLISLNGGVAFTVLEIEGDNALCEFFGADEHQTMQKEVFKVSDLNLIYSAKGGFF